jgi:hypothetical protein
MVRKSESIQKYKMVSASWFHNYNRLQRTVNITLCLRVEEEIFSLNGKMQINKATAAQTAFVQKKSSYTKTIGRLFSDYPSHARQEPSATPSLFSDEGNLHLRPNSWT